jgi:hypothetical protein
MLLVACSNLTETAGSIVRLEVLSPLSPTLEVSDTQRILARALDQDDTEVSATIQWLTADTTVTVDGSGLVTGVFPGSADIRARLDDLISNTVRFSIIPRPDTLVLVGEDTLRVLAADDTSAALIGRLDTYRATDTVPASGGQIVYEIVDPVFADPGQRTVELTGQVLIDTVTTGSAGTPSVQMFLSRVGRPSPDSAIVEMRAFRASGTEAVPGSGQRFVVRFDP